MRICRGVRCLALITVAALSVAGSPAADDRASRNALIDSVTGADDPLVRAAAAEELGRLDPASSGVAGRVVPVLIEALSFDLDFPVRGRAAEALGRLGPVTRDVVPALIAALEWDTHLMVRWRATEAVERIATRHPQVAAAVVPALLTALKGDEYPGVRARAAASLGAVDPGEAAVVPALIQAFQRDKHPGVRWQAAAALENLARHYEENGTAAAVADLREALAALADHPHPDVQRHAEGVRQAIRRISAKQSSSAPE